VRLAIFSDIHGNPYACQAVLKDVAASGGVDLLLAAGDLCLGGSHPAACINLLAEAGVRGVFGNTETYLFHPDLVPPDELHRKKWDRLHPAVLWTLDRMLPAHLDWLHQLPFQQRFCPTSAPEEDLLCVHANPQDVELMIYPEPDGQLRLWGEIRQPDQDPTLLATLRDISAHLVVFGHFHHAFQRQVGHHHLVDVAPCSLPAIDHDQRAHYTLFTWTTSGWVIDPHAVAYPVEKEIGALQASNMPFKEDFLRTFG
jgi:predicted phosphodiesterase